MNKVQNILNPFIYIISIIILIIVPILLLKYMPNIQSALFSIIIFVLVACLTVLLLNNANYFSFIKSEQEKFIYLILGFFAFIFVAGIAINLKSSFSDIGIFFQQTGSFLYPILYIIFLIMMFVLLPDSIKESYPYLISPITLLLGLFAFYKGYTTNYIGGFKLEYERVKNIILFFCLITTLFLYYIVDPGGYFKNYFGSSMLITIIFSMFSLLYLIILLTMPSSNIGTTNETTNLFSKFTSGTVVSTILFFIFLTAITILFSSSSNNFLNDKGSASIIILLVFLICISWGSLLVTNLFTGSNMTMNNVSNYTHSLLVLFGLIISSLVIYWLVYNIQSLTNQTGLTSAILNIILVLIVLVFLYKIINITLPVGNANKNAAVNLLLSLVFYIPCIFDGTFTSISKLFVDEYNASSLSMIIMSVTLIAIIILYFTTPSLFSKLTLQGGKQLVNKPVYTDKQYNLGNYESLTKKTQFDYQFAVSSWIYLDAVPPNMNLSYKKYTSLLNFSNNPNILYNGTDHSLIITMDQNEHSLDPLSEYDENGKLIIYKNNNVLLQKWNNIIVNYNGGFLDIFLNGELIKSNIGIVPHDSKDTSLMLSSFTIGEVNGVKGGICNVVYFDNVLTANNVYYLYNLVKNNTPPTLDDSSVTIVKNNI